MKIKYEHKEYEVMESACKKRACFVPFSGNGQNICRKYELGQCPTGEELKLKKKKKSPISNETFRIMDLIDLY